MKCRTAAIILLAPVSLLALAARTATAEESQGSAAAVATTSPDAPSDEAKFVAFDGFEGKLQLPWNPLRPDPTHVSLTKHAGKLTITTQHGSIHQSDEYNRQRNAPPAKNIYLLDNPLPDDVGFVATTCLDAFEPTTPYQQAGLIVRNDDDNYLKWVCEVGYLGYADARPLLNLLREEKAQSSITKFGLEGDRKRLWLRLTKRGGHYEFASGADGKTFTVHGELPWGEGPPKQIGLLAKNGGSPQAGDVDARFDLFELRSLTSAETSEPRFVERQKLQGTWEVLSCQLSGKSLEKVPLFQFVFTDTKVTIAEKDKSIQADYTLDVTAQPRQLLLSAFLEGTSGQVRGVYSLEEDKLVMCLSLRPGAPAPDQLATREGDGRMLVTLQRAQGSRN